MNIKQILNNSGFRFNKQFGQNFLTDDAVLESICADAGIDGGTVLEVGTGAGTLTRVLARHADKVVTFEIDRNLQPVLAATLADCANVQLVIGDVMRYTVEQIEQLCGDNYRIVANIPYYITSPFIMRFVEETDRVRSITLTVQKEVAERLAASAGTKEYGAISVAVQSVARVTVTRILSKELFYPVPKVDSAVVALVFDRREDIADRALFRKTVRAAFAMRRKTLVNCLSVGFGIDKEHASRIIERCGFASNCRGEELNVAEFVKLYESIQGEGLK